MRILYVTTIGRTMGFFKELIRDLMEEGHVVDIATNEEIEEVPEFFKILNCEIYNISCTRSPLNKGNFLAIRELKTIVEKGDYDIVHCHTPIAAMCTRLACKKFRKNGLRVIYTAHGFHFYSGAPFKNWMMYYPVEVFCSRYTDVLLTINQEDYDIAKRKMRAKSIEYIPGPGVDIHKFRNASVDKTSKRSELGIPADSFLITSVGELNTNKNHEIIIRAIATLNENIHYVIAGIGTLDNYLLDLSRNLGIGDRVHLLGFRNDIAEIYKASDLCCFPSKREGLGLAAIEAMAAGIPVIAADSRGTREFIVDGKSGFMCSHNDVNDFTLKIKRCMSLKSNELDDICSTAQSIVDKFDMPTVIKKTKQIYKLI